MLGPLENIFQLRGLLLQLPLPLQAPGWVSSDDERTLREGLGMRAVRALAQAPMNLPKSTPLFRAEAWVRAWVLTSSVRSFQKSACLQAAFPRRSPSLPQASRLQQVQTQLH